LRGWVSKSSAAVWGGIMFGKKGEREEKENFE